MIRRSYPKTRKPVQKCDGILYAGGIMTAEGCMATLGLGSASMRDARRSGLVKPIYCGRKAFYETEQVIAWIKSHKEA